MPRSRCVIPNRPRTRRDAAGGERRSLYARHEIRERADRAGAGCSRRMVRTRLLVGHHQQVVDRALGVYEFEPQFSQRFGES